MATLESRTYQDTRDALAGNTIMMWLMTVDTQGKEIIHMDDSELETQDIARRNSETGRMEPTSGFMNAVNRRFRQLEDANPDRRFTGPMHIGAVAEVILAQRERNTATERKLIPGLAARAGKACFRMRDDLTVREVHDLFCRLLDAAGF